MITRLRVTTISILFAFGPHIASCSSEEEPKSKAKSTDAPTEETDAGPDAGDSGVSDSGSPQLPSENPEPSTDENESTPKSAKVYEQLAFEIRERRLALDLRERELAHRETLLKNLEVSTVQMAGEIERLKSELTAVYQKLEKRYEQQRSANETNRQQMAESLNMAVEEMADERKRRIAHLVKTIKGMRAAAGAELLASMEDADAVEVLQKLSARQAASFLGSMPPKKAAKLAQDMLGPRLPPAGIFNSKAAQPQNQESP